MTQLPGPVRSLTAPGPHYSPDTQYTPHTAVSTDRPGCPARCRTRWTEPAQTAGPVLAVTEKCPDLTVAAPSANPLIQLLTPLTAAPPHTPPPATPRGGAGRGGVGVRTRYFKHSSASNPNSNNQVTRNATRERFLNCLQLVRPGGGGRGGPGAAERRRLSLRHNTEWESCNY